MATGSASAPGSGAAFRHEAMLYAGPDDFVARIGPFIRDGLTADEPILVVVGGGKIELLRSELGAAAGQVRFTDMAEVGRNPGRIIPEWQAFVDEHAGSGRLRGIGEPIWPDRTADELVECERHEALLNVAFADAQTWWLMCPYDTSTLDLPVLKEAERNHPFVLDGGSHRESSRFQGLAELAQPFDHPLPEPNVAPDEMSFGVDQLDALRTFTAHHAARFGLALRRSADLVLAVDEVATNSLRHGGGHGVLRIWENENALVCEVRDRGRIDDPLVGRKRPGPDRMSGFGLYAVNQLCDLVQVRSFESGSVVRLHMSRA